MAEAEVKILTVDAVQNMNDLRKAIHDTKEELAKQELGGERYKELLQELIKEQNLMRGAMNGTTAKMEDLKAAADGTAKTYNGLVNQMANMKRELRNIDVSTEDGAQAFKELAAKINSVNDELKAMDAMKGDFQRNVGNYESAFKGWAEKTDALRKGLTAATGGLNGMHDGLEAISKSPAIASVGILVSLAMRLATEVKKDDEAMAAVKKGMEALRPVMDFLSGLLDKVVDIVADLIDKAAAFLGSSGLFAKIINGAAGVGNAVLQFIVAPFKGIVAAIKVFQEEGVKGIGNAAKAFGAEVKNGVAFKQNFATGQAFADGIIAGAKSRKEKAKEEAGKAAEEVAETMAERLYKRYEEAAARYERTYKERNAQLLEAQRQFDADMESEVDAYFQNEVATIQAAMDAEKKAQEDARLAAEKAAKEKMETMNQYASGASSIMGSIADILESETEEGEKSTKATKALRISAAIIDTISGAISAYTSTWASTLPMTAKMILAPVNAASVVAAGMANVAKMRATTVSASSAPNTAPSVPATVSAPSIPTAVPTTTVTEGASQTTRLNRAASPQKVYILQSDIEAAGDASQVQVAESTF